ncbi:MAG TPA: 7-cyano-7-deazaguanine synthase QueC [Candidatus Hydrogenedentes bacterium]|nr:7-cyano-7-deazaguanine synthase QueC [Candidatus Hydrogenedentota bacterium]
MTEPLPAVVLLSGGIDSSVLAHYATNALGCAPVHALSFDYGQLHRLELECARFQAAAAGVVEHRVIDVSFLGDVLRPGSALIAGGDAVPDLVALAAEQLDQPPTYVPNRNMMLISMAAAYAETRGIRDVFYGAQAQDEYGYWDCTRAFVDRINDTLALNRRDAVRVHAPFIEKRKADTVRLGLELGVDFTRTWSCYRGGERPCGTCPTCVERRNAFHEAGAEDPLEQRA